MSLGADNPDRTIWVQQLLHCSANAPLRRVSKRLGACVQPLPTRAFPICDLSVSAALTRFDVREKLAKNIG
jgi:hypothetical protein